MTTVPLSDDLVGPHHAVVLMVDEVAVPDVETPTVEGGLEPGDPRARHKDRVLGPDLMGSGRRRGTAAQRLSVEQLELDEVYMEEVAAGREVMHLPGLGRAERRILGERV